MRDRLRRVHAALRRWLDQSAWVPLLLRAAGLGGALVLLAAVGMGWFDRSFDLGPPRAEAASRGDRSSPSDHPHQVRAAPPAAEPPPRAVASASGPPPAPPSAKVVLNTASAAELDRLPGVGPAKAAAIVALRTKLGGKLKRFEDLLRVRGIKRKLLERIREHAVLDPPPVEDASPEPSSSSPRAPALPAPSASSPW